MITKTDKREIDEAMEVHHKNGIVTDNSIDNLEIRRHHEGMERKANESQSDLKPCPFCGALAQIKETHRGHFIVQCTNEDCLVSVMPEMSPLAAKTVWNTRA